MARAESELGKVVLVIKTIRNNLFMEESTTQLAGTIQLEFNVHHIDETAPREATKEGN